jgi:hypothetical protein
MPGTTTTRNLTTLLSADTVTSFATTINSVTTSVETELNKTVGFYNYLTATATARNALTGMADGSIAFQVDTNEYWWYDLGALAWKLYAKPKTSYTPTVTSLGSTTPTLSAFYTVSNGICYVEIIATITSVTSLFAAVPTLTVPITYSGYAGTTQMQPAGPNVMYDASLTQQFQGANLWASATTVSPYYFSSVAGGRLLTPIPGGGPFSAAWAIGDKIMLNITYPV